MTLAIVALVEILKTISPSLSIRTKVYPRMMPLGLSGAFQIMMAHVEVIVVAVTATGALGAAWYRIK